MKQVYTQQNQNQPPSVRAHVKAWVLFFGFLIWLLAVKETFGQAAHSSAGKANTQITALTPLSGACTITASATLQYQVDKGSSKYFVLMQGQTITFRLKNGRTVLSSATGITNAQGVATAQLPVLPGTNFIEAVFATTSAYRESSADAPFTIEDKIAPVVAARSSVSLSLDDAGKASLGVADVLNAASTDVCGIRSEVLSRTAFDCASKGSHTVTLTVTDINNNVTVRQIAVNVADHQAPVPSVASLPVLTGECSVKATAPQALDNCAGLLTAATAQPLEYNQQGSYTITWRYNDGNGNVTEQQQQVVVRDVTHPVISNVPADLTVAAAANCQAVVSWIAPAAADNCELASLTADVAPGTALGLGTRKITYTATDKAGNVSKASFLVTVEDKTAPAVVVKNATIYLDAQGKALLPLDSVRVSSTDNCGILAEVLSQQEFTCFHVGSLPVTLTVTDNNGNVTEKTVTVTVAEKVKPVVNVQAVTLQLDANGQAALTAAQVDNGSYDNCKIASLALSQYNFSCEHVGVNPVTLTVTDVNGNVNTAQASVTVEDKIAPAVEVRNVTLPLLEDGKAILKASDVKVSATDACGIRSEILSDTLFSCAQAGLTREVIFTVTDAHGNATHKTVLVNVADQTRPVVVTKPATLYLNASGAASLSLDDVRESSRDNCGIASQVLSKMTFGCENLGENKVLLTVTDPSGNETVAEATVTVADQTAPVIAGMPANLELSAGANCQAIGSWAAPSFSDNCGIKGFTATHPIGTAFGLGVTTVTYTVEDNAGNTQQASFTVTVTNAAPQLTQIVAPAAPVSVIHAVPVTLAFADNNLTGAVIEWGDGSSASYDAAAGSNTLTASHTYAAPGLYALKVTLTDACGAQATGTYEYVMVNNPTDGFITGGGWINSPAGALAGTTFAGKASYEFNAKYDPATGLSSGSATFSFPAGALSFASNRIEWLVLADAKAWIKGTGTVNGVSGYTFLLSAVDSELNGYRNMDTFRMQIWDKSGALVYDNQRNAARNAPAGQVIAGGSIVVHTKKEATASASSSRMGTEAAGQVSLGLKAYPNPSAGHFKITANENLTADAPVTVLDLRGQPVYRGVLRANGGRTLEVDLTTKGAGVYVVQVNVNGQREVLKLVKQ